MESAHTEALDVNVNVPHFSAQEVIGHGCTTQGGRPHNIIIIIIKKSGIMLTL